jgi:hypothetical protein
MNRVVVDEGLLTKLYGLKGKLEFCDATGRTLGHFLPVEETTTPLPESDGCPYTADELQRFQQETGGRPLSEIWKSLRQS